MGSWTYDLYETANAYIYKIKHGLNFKIET